MAHLFNLTIETALGSCSGTERASSRQQIADAMPAAVVRFDAAEVPLSDDGSVVDDEELMLDLLTYVSNIEQAAAMTPEYVAEEHAQQRRALRGLTVRIAPAPTAITT